MVIGGYLKWSGGGFVDFLGWESMHVDHWKGLIWGDNPDKPIELRGHETDGMTDIACEKLRQLKNTKEPFFLFLSYQAPHHPCSPPAEFLDIYKNKNWIGRGNTDKEALLRPTYATYGGKKREEWNED